MAYGEDRGATGWLVGPEHGGMRAMFTMMNNARLNVGLQGVGLAERATSARGRLCARSQARPAQRPADDDRGHPDVRRMLVRMRALTMAARALVIMRSGRQTVGRWEIARRVFAPTSSLRW